jgi:HEAT repeat protein
MQWRRFRPRFRLSTLAILIALCSLLIWAGQYFFSPTKRIIRQIQADQPTYLRREAVGGLGYVPAWEAAEAINALIGALKDPSPQVRENALSGLHAHGVRARRAIPEILKQMVDVDRSVRFSACFTLGSMFTREDHGSEHDAVIAALKTALADPDHLNRVAAAISLLRLGERQAAIPAIALSVTDPDENQIKDQARSYLARFCPKIDLSPAVTPLLRDDNPKRRQAALNFLLEAAPPKAVIAALKESRTDPSLDVRRWVADKLKSLTLDLSSSAPDPESSFSLAERLRYRGPERAGGKNGDSLGRESPSNPATRPWKSTSGSKVPPGVSREGNPSHSFSAAA